MELTERRADLRTTFLIYDMLYIFVTETLQSTDDRKRCTLSKSTESHTLNHGCKFFQFIKVGHFALSFYDSFEDFQHTFGSFTTWNTFAAAFALCKVHKESGNFYHTGVFVHYYQTTGTHDRIQ